MFDFLKTIQFKRDPRIIIFAAVLVLVVGFLIVKGLLTAKEGLLFLSGVLALPGLFGAKPSDAGGGDDEDPPDTSRSTKPPSSTGTGGPLMRLAAVAGLVVLGAWLAIVLSACSPLAAANPAQKKTAAEATYTGELAACVEKSRSRREADACADDVRRRWAVDGGAP